MAITEGGVDRGLHGAGIERGPHADRLLVALEEPRILPLDLIGAMVEAVKLEVTKTLTAIAVLQLTGSGEPGPLLLPSGLHAEVGAYAKARWAAMNR